MVNPVLTVLFDLFLIGSAASVIAAMIGEYMQSKTPSVGSTSGRAHRWPAATAGRHDRYRESASTRLHRLPRTVQFRF